MFGKAFFGSLQTRPSPHGGLRDRLGFWWRQGLDRGHGRLGNFTSRRRGIARVAREPPLQDRRFRGHADRTQKRRTMAKPPDRKALIAELAASRAALTGYTTALRDDVALGAKIQRSFHANRTA